MKASRCVEDFSRREHAVHDDGKLPGDRHRSAPEAQAFTQPRSPVFETAFRPSASSREDHDRCFVNQAPKMIVTSSGDMTVIVGLSRSVASSCQSKLGSNRARRFEVARIFNCCNLGNCRNGTDTQDRH